MRFIFLSFSTTSSMMGLVQATVNEIENYSRQNKSSDS